MKVGIPLRFITKKTENFEYSPKAQNDSYTVLHV